VRSVRPSSHPATRPIILIVAAALMFAACGPTANAPASVAPAPASGDAAASTAPTGNVPEGPIEIRIWDPHGPNFAKIADVAIADYKAIHPNVTVKIEPVDNSVYLTRILTAASAGTLPDIIYAGPGIIQSMLKDGNVFGPMPVDQFKDQLSKTVSAFIKLQQDNQGNQVLLPMGGGYHGWEYRVDLLSAAGFSEFPRTWSQLIDACQKLVVRDGNGTITREGVSWRFRSYGLRVEFQALLGTQGVTMLDSTGKVNIDTPEGLKVLTLMHDTVYKYNCSLPLSKKQVPPVGVLPLALGLAAIDFQFPGSETFAINYAKDHPEYASLWNKTPLWPKPDEGGQDYVLISGDGFGVSKSTPNASTAWDFISFLSQYKYAVQLATFSTVARSDVMQDPSIAGFYAQAPNAKNVLDLFTNPDVAAKAVPDITDPHTPQIETIFADSLTAMFEDPNADLAATLRDMQAQVEDALKQ
jgi:ABC-type glycerol-3-phosphate transport system substrate-binding protein